MKAKNIIIIIACIVLAAFALGATGTIHLVSASENETTSSDKLIGVLITREPLDLFDNERFLTDNIDKLVKGKEISESERAKYQGRIYAALVETGHTNEETGETGGRKEYVFEGVDGICYFAPQITDQFGTYWSSSGDSAISDGNINFNSTDVGESITLEGTIYVSTGEKTGKFYFNPVYQASTGEVYAVSGNGMFSDNNTAGMSMSHEIKEEQSSTIGDLTTSSGSRIKITISYIDEPAKVSILQFDSENKLLSQMDCEPDKLPNTLQPQPGTQYIIVETTTFSQDQTINISRTLYQSQDETLFVFSCRDDGICVKQWCEINWSESNTPEQAAGASIL